MEEYWLIDADDDITKPLKCSMSLMCGLLTGMCTAFEWCSLNHTTTLGRHFLTWYSSCIQLFDYWSGPLELSVLTILGHLVIQGVFVLIMFNWWKVPYYTALCGSRLVCFVRYPENRGLFSRKFSNLDVVVAILVVVLSTFVGLLGSKEKLPPGSWIIELIDPLVKRIAPMWDIYPDWTIYLKQIAKYLVIQAVWMLWWVPLVIPFELITVSIFKLFRRKNEPIQGGDDCVGWDSESDE